MFSKKLISRYIFYNTLLFLNLYAIMKGFVVRHCNTVDSLQLAVLCVLCIVVKLLIRLFESDRLPGVFNFFINNAIIYWLYKKYI